MILIQDLIQNDESDSLDFKREWHANKASLVHDILSLSNSLIKSNRYLVLGIDDAKQVIGVENDLNRKTQAQLVDFLRAIQLNSLPAIKLHTFEVDGHEIDVIEMKDIPEKPYFLNRDYREGILTVRAGVTYTRDGDSNTPIDRCASEVKIEKMFQERFGILESPYERFRRYLKDKENWKYGYDEENSLYFYYLPFPEFTVLSNSKNEHEEFSEPWLLRFPDTRGSRDEFLLKYHATIMDKIYVIWCDGARLGLVMPNQRVVDPNGACATSYFYVFNSVRYLAKEMINHAYPNQSRDYIDEIFSFFETEEEAERELKNSFNNGSPTNYTYYVFKETDRRYYEVTTKGKRKLKEK